MVIGWEFLIEWRKYIVEWETISIGQQYNVMNPLAKNKWM
jgi:hypothetical protein